MRQTINGADFRRMLLSAAAAIEIKPLRQIFEELYTGSQAVLKATEAAWQ